MLGRGGVSLAGNSARRAGGKEGRGSGEAVRDGAAAGENGRGSGEAVRDGAVAGVKGRGSGDAVRGGAAAGEKGRGAAVRGCGEAVRGCGKTMGIGGIGGRVCGAAAAAGKVLYMEKVRGGVGGRALKTSGGGAVRWFGNDAWWRRGGALRGAFRGVVGVTGVTGVTGAVEKTDVGRGGGAWEM